MSAGTKSQWPGYPHTCITSRRSFYLGGGGGGVCPRRYKKKGLRFTVEFLFEVLMSIMIRKRGNPIVKIG